MIRGGTWSLLPWSWSLCVFVEQLWPVASRQVTRHLEGRSACPTSPSSSPVPTSPLRPSLPHLPPPPLLHAEYLRVPDQTSKQTEQQKNPSRRQARPRAWGRDGERSCLLSGPVPFQCDGGEGLPGHRDPGFLFDFQGENQGGPLASSCDPIHSWLAFT